MDYALFHRLDSGRNEENTMKALVVDDDPASLGALCSMLRTCGHTVDTAPGAQLAIRMMGMTSYDVIFLDYNMPEHNGVWFMRNAPVPKETAVVLVTGFVDPMAMSDFRRMGIEVVMKKPFTLGAIQGSLKGILEDAQQRDAPTD
jgi:two-component system chemotaxis response regulator CheY